MRRRRAADPGRAARRRAREQYLADLRALREGKVSRARTFAPGDVLAVAGRVLGEVVQVDKRMSRVRLVPGGARPKARAIRAPSWLEVVRMMPCAGCGAGRPFREQLGAGAAQSEAHHAPGRGRAAGGSDLETCPLCRACHEQATAHRISERDQERLVAETLLRVVRAIREGRIAPGLLIAAGVEAVVHEEG